MATTTIKGTIKSALAPRILTSGKWLEELVICEKTKNKEHEHLIQNFTDERPYDEAQEHVGESVEAECYVNSKSYIHPSRGLKYATNLTLKNLKPL